jgi:hypothetical protein
LERNQQDFIKQLDHANSLATEYHETAVMYQRKHDAALHEMNDLKNQHAREIAELFERLNRAEEETRDERALKEEYTQQIEGLKQLLAECEARNHCEEQEEEMSPVSVASPSPREQPQQQQRPQPIQSFNTCYSESEEDEGAYYHDGDTESDGEYYYNEECQCLECREMYAANNANTNNDLCQCDECRSSQSSQTYEYDADGKLVPVCYQSDNGDN